MARDMVVVTGGTGFLAAHCIVQLLDAGYSVRTTVRNLARAEYVREMVAAGGQDGAKVQLIEADLLADDGWQAAMHGATYVLHVASPFPAGSPDDENELIRPAREGTKRVLRAAHEAGVARTVVTSSFAAVGYGQSASGPVTEKDWTDIAGPGVTAYVKSKTLAERAAWDFAASHPAMQVATICPVAIVGPILGPDLSSSCYMIQQAMNGAIPRLPKGSINLVDVRDVAALHLLAMTHPLAAGERFLASQGDPMPLPAMARLLRERLGEQAAAVPRKTIPTWLLRALAALVPSLREVAERAEAARPVDTTKARELLDWRPRSSADGVIATATSLGRFGLLRTPNVAGRRR